MNKGIIGIFKCAEKGDEWCSISVRSSESSEKLKSAMQSEHPNLKLELAKSFGFECNCEIVDVEKKLRELLVLAFGEYVPPYKEWECYKVNSNEIESFISGILSLGKDIAYYNELTV